MAPNNDLSKPSIRAFAGVAIESSPALERVLARLGGMGKAVRPMSSIQLHVTLKFYGDMESSVVPQIAQALGERLSASKSFDWELKGLGAFPSQQRPSIIWAGIEDDGRFAALANELDQLSESLGFERERRAFHPHVTLARVKFRPPPDLAELLREFSEKAFGRQRAEEVVLFRSELTGGGSIYTPLHRFKLTER